jgi:FlaA1/EpsC-like NDP-sugar epimerase
MVNKSEDKVRTIIVGAGKAGELLANGIKNSTDSGVSLIGFVDDDLSKQNRRIKGLPVLGKLSDLPQLVKHRQIEEIIIALPSERGKIIRSIIESTTGHGLHYKILPRLAEVLLQDYDEDYIKYIRSVKAEDLLGGEIAKSDQADISSFAKKQTVMITGAAGSIGSELSRQIVAHKAKKVILFDWWENGMFELRNQLAENHPDADIIFVIGDIKDRDRLYKIMSLHKPTTVFHAAAYKHVPLMEENPTEAVKNNIFGTKTVAETAIECDVKKFILISTDKAVNPTNIMGATKRAAEELIHVLSEIQSQTIFCAVRFGNVINSNGSAIPTFERQIEKGGPVTVTHKDITRYFMTISEAVHLILQSWIMGKSDDLFVLDMGEPIRIYDLARLLITLHGYIPDEEIKIKIIGLRLGEKLYEEVLVKEEETRSTAVKKVFRTKNYVDFDKLAFLYNLGIAEGLVSEDSLNTIAIRQCMKRLVSTYQLLNR